MVPICGIPLVPGLRERVIQIGLDAVYPPVIPEVRVVDFKSAEGLSQSDRAVVVIRVNESETGGHAIDNRTTVYLRVENISDPFRKATVGELEWFINKREKAIQEKDRILDLTREHTRQYLIRLRTRNGMSTSEPAAKCVFWTVPCFPRRPLASPQELMKLARDLHWRLEYHRQDFPLGTAQPVREGIFFDGEYSSMYRYTEIQQQGLAYHEYGFWWDFREPSWRSIVFPSSIAELLLAGLRLAAFLYPKTGYWGSLEIRMSLVGVRGRTFYDLVQRGFPPRGEGSADDEISVLQTSSVSELSANGTALVRQMMTDIAWAFGVQNCPRTVEEILAKAKADQILQPPQNVGPDV